MNDVFDIGVELEKFVNQGTPKKSKPQKAPKNERSGFPFQVITGGAGYFANVYSEILECPETFLFIGYLTMLGSVFSRKMSIKSSLRTQPRLYTVLLGQSATDRKSTALNIIADHFKDVISGYRPCYGVNSAEGLRNVLLANEEDDLAEKPGTILLYDEFKAFVSKCQISASTLLPLVTTLYESNIHETQLKNDSFIINDAHLSILAASTVETYERVYDAAFINIGFPNRVFIVPGTAGRRFSIPPTLDPKENIQLNENLKDILKFVGEKGIQYELTESAKVAYHEWYMNIPQTLHSKRLDTISYRLMMLLAVNNMKTIIDDETVSGATSLCDWQLAMRRLHDPIDAENKMAEMENRILRTIKGSGALTERDLKNKTNAYRRSYGIWVFDNALKNLVNSGDIKWDRNTKKYTDAE